LAIIGSIFPTTNARQLHQVTIGTWINHYKLFCMTALLASIAAALLSVVHFSVELG
jgi:hypothetical protein